MITHSSDFSSNARKVDTCAKFLTKGYRGYTPSKTGLILLQEVASKDSREEPGNYLSLGLRVSRQNKNQVINAFPSLRNSHEAIRDIAQKRGRDALFILSDYFPVNTMNLGDPLRRRRANCMVAALAWFGLTDNLDLFHEDFSNLLKDNFEPLKPSAEGTSLLPETLVTWCGTRSNTWQACHAAVYLGDNIVWHKVGINAPVYTSIEKVMETYGATGAPSDKSVMRYFRLKR